MKARVYRRRNWGNILKRWQVGTHRYTLETIASFARSEPILDGGENVELPDQEQVDANCTSRILAPKR